jgi:thiamine pyrophosphate-dependent acetolactate synthase large subunit-like protein
MTLLHLGPGLGNGIANLHNARRARTPILNVIGEHATWHRSADSPLRMDIVALAESVSGWQRTSTVSQHLSQDTADAVTAASAGKVATLIVPSDIQWSESPDVNIHSPKAFDGFVEKESIERALALLRTEKKAALILGGWALRKRGLAAAARIKVKICSNRSYNILNIEFSRSGITSPGRYAQTLTDLSNPTLDWVQISKGMGVPAVVVDSCEALARELKIALDEPGPHLIEMLLLG